MANNSPQVQRAAQLQAAADNYQTKQFSLQGTDQSTTHPTVQRAEADIPTGVHANFIIARYKAPNFELIVTNARQKNGENIGGRLPNGGSVKECVENTGDLKGETQHSGWSNRASMMDTHSIPRHRLCGGTTGKRFFQAGQTIANQLFLYADNEVSETPIPNSGFEINYVHRVYNANGDLVSDSAKVDVEEGMYSIFELEKRPHSVTAEGHKAHEGSGGSGHHQWKIEQPEKGSLAWRVTKL